MPLLNTFREGLRAGRVTFAAKLWVTRPCCFCSLRHFSRLRFLPPSGRTLHLYRGGKRWRD